MTVAHLILGIAGGYAAIGLVFAAAFVSAGAQRLDHAGAGASWGFRVLLIPGSAALWPLLAVRWRQACKEEHR